MFHRFFHNFRLDQFVTHILRFPAYHELHPLLFSYPNQSSVAYMREFTDGPLPSFEDVAFRINVRTVAMSPSCMCVVSFLNFGKCFKAYFLLKRVPMLSGPEVISFLYKDVGACLEVTSSTVCTGKNRFKLDNTISHVNPWTGQGDNKEKDLKINIVLIKFRHGVTYFSRHQQHIKES